MELPKFCRFKKIAKTEHLFISSGLVSNMHWIFDIQWLLSLPRSRALGLIALQNATKKAQVKATLARINGQAYRTHDLEAIVAEVSKKTYRPAPQGSIEFIDGHYKGDYKKPGAVALTFKTRSAPILDIEYAAALFFETETMILIAGPTDPVILKDHTGKIVAMIMGLDPEKFKEKDN